MTQFLASVQSLAEASVALRGGADIIDLKAPSRGSLGALPIDQIAEITDALRGVVPVSATVGDLPLQPERVTTAAISTFEAGVDFVKVGFFPDGDEHATLRALEMLAKRGVPLIAVLFGDCAPAIDLPARLANAGFRGCMLDTMDKKRGSLMDVCEPAYLQQFVTEVADTGLMCGLAGSLRLADIPSLLPLRPDVLGFRGALCCNRQRTATLDPEQVREVAARIRGASPRKFCAPDKRLAETQGKFPAGSAVPPLSREIS